MPHAIHDDGLPRLLREDVAVGDRDGVPLAWFRRLENGDALVLAAPDAQMNGQPLLGGIGIIPWGQGARVRTGGLRVDVAWRAGAEERSARAGQSCRLCFGAFAAAEAIVACGCEALFHLECDAARVDCPACGAGREGGPP